MKVINQGLLQYLLYRNNILENNVISVLSRWWKMAMGIKYHLMKTELYSYTDVFRKISYKLLTSVYSRLLTRNVNVADVIVTELFWGSTVGGVHFSQPFMLKWPFFQWSASLSCVQQHTTTLHISTACEDQERTHLTSSRCQQPLACTWPPTQPPSESCSWAHIAAAKFHRSPHTYTRLALLRYDSWKPVDWINLHC